MLRLLHVATQRAISSSGAGPAIRPLQHFKSSPNLTPPRFDRIVEEDPRPADDAAATTISPSGGETVRARPAVSFADAAVVCSDPRPSGDAEDEDSCRRGGSVPRGFRPEGADDGSARTRQHRSFGSRLLEPSVQPPPPASKPIPRPPKPPLGFGSATRRFDEPAN